MAIAQTGKQRQQLAKVCVLAAGFWFCNAAWSVDNSTNIANSTSSTNSSASSSANSSTNTNTNAGTNSGIATSIKASGAATIAAITNFAGITGVAPTSSAATQPLLGNINTSGTATTSSTSPTSPSTTSLALARLQDITNRASELAVQAMSMLGINYRYGGTSPETGLDCSGLVRYVFKEAWGTDLPRTSAEISRIGERVDKLDLRPGDLVVDNPLRRGFSHVGIYLGDRKFIHSPSAGGQVRIEDMDLAYWKKRFNGARRIIGGDSDDADGDNQK